ncbi:hypothetical protein L9F63_009428, partial [Diploptera punctata]
VLRNIFDPVNETGKWKKPKHININIEPNGSSRHLKVGPPLLTPLSEDASLETTPAWSVRQSSLLLPESAVAAVRSNIWPGAFAFAIG